MATKSYKDLSGELDQVMADLEQGDLDIDEAVECYERGLTLVKQLESYLQQAENKVIALKASVATSDSEAETDRNVDGVVTADDSEEL